MSLGEAWPGISVELAARGNNVEKLFTVAPGADVRRISIRVKGATRIERSAHGSLVAHTGNGPIAFSAPVAWQDIGGERLAVDVRYSVAGNRYGFMLGKHDRAHEVIIDPIVEYTFVGGSGSDLAKALASDGSSLYLVGSTSSTNFPGTAGGAQPAPGGSTDAFVARFDRDLNLLQATYFGGSASDFAFAVKVGRSGDVYIAGSTQSTNLPGTAASAQPSSGGSTDGFVARLSADLMTLRRATYVGGTATDQIRALALDANDNVFGGGTTTSTNLPGTAGGAQPNAGGSNDVFVVKLNPDLAVLMQATYLGGSSVDIAGNSMIVNAAGELLVPGTTRSTNFPVTVGAAQTTFGGGTNDAFVAKFSNDLQSILRATFIGGGGDDFGNGVAIDANGDVYVAGSTASADFPWVVGGAQPVFGGDTDGFVVAFNSDLASPGRATYIGGSGSDTATVVAIHPLKSEVVVGGVGNSADRPRPPGPSLAGGNHGKALRATGSTDENRPYDYSLPTSLREFWRTSGDEADAEDAAAEEVFDLLFEQGLKYFVYTTAGTGAPLAAGTRPSGGLRARTSAQPRTQPVSGGGLDGIIFKYVEPSFQGLWWNSPPGSESGWGINLAHQGDTIFATWFTYDLDGKPWWLGVVALRTGANVYQGDLFTTTGPPFSAVPFDPASITETVVGSATFTFIDADTATFEYTVNVNAPAKLAITQTKTITRQAFGTLPACVWAGQPDPAPATNYQDLWWKLPAGSESGWGINFTHQDDIIFATWFTYDLAGKPWWLGFVANKTAQGAYAGDVFTTAGPPFNAVPFDPANVVETTIGTATLTFSNGNDAAFTYTVNGVTQAKPIERQVFATLGTVCD